MSRYSLRPYVSVYKDPGSVQINTLQRQKFQQAFNADDAIAGAVDQMQAADFEGDQALKMELEQNTRQQLQDRAARGDYETMMMDVSKSAREFDKNYQPIKQNYEMYQAYQNRVKDAYDKGDINALTYNRALAKSNFGYSGLERNEDGSIDDGSYFSGYSFVKDVDIQALMSEAMDDFAAKKGGQVVQTVGQGPDAMYTIKVGNKYETVTPDQVNTVFNEVMARPDVAASVAQQVDLTTFDITDEQIRQRLTASLYGDENDPDNNGLVGLRDKAIADGNDELAAQLDEKIQKETKLLSGAGLESEAEQIQARQKYLKDETLSGIIGQQQQTAITKFAYENIFTEYIQDYDQKYLVGLKSALDKYVPAVSFDTGVTELQNPGGVSLEDVNGYIETYQGAELLVSNEATKYAREQGLIGEDAIISAEDIMNGRVPEQMQGVLKSYQNKIEDARANIYLQEQRLQEAYEATGYVQGVENVKKNTYGDITGQEFISNARDILNMPNATDEQVAARIADLGNYSKELQGGTGTSAALEAKIGDVRLAQQQINQLGGNLVAKFTSDMNPSLDKVNDYLEKNSKILVAGTTSTNFPGETDAMAQTNTKAIKSTFEKRPLNPNFRIFYGGLKQDGTGSVASLIEDYKLPANTQLKVTQVTFDKQPYLGEPTVSMQLDAVDPKTGENIIVKVPTSNFQASGMDQYFNDPMYKIAMTYGRASVAGLDNANVGFYNSNGQYAGHLQYNFNDGGDVVSVGLYDINKGLINTMTPNDPELEQIIRLSDERGQSFRLMTN
jgi:hypothetical protein